MKELKTLFAAALAAMFLTVPVWADDDDDDDDGYNQVVPYGTHKLDVDVWVDKGQDASYYPGEDIRVFFRANQDAYVLLYNVDTQGRVSLLFPYDYRDQRLVQGDRPVPVPGNGEDYYLKVNGPAGTEMVVAIVSREPFPIADLGWNSDLEDLRAEDYYYMHRAEGEDIWDFVERLNRRLVPAHVDYELDVETFTVQQRYQRDYYVDPGFYFSYYRYPHYYPDWYFGAVYFDYPYRSAVYIDGIFFGWTPLFMPRFLYGHYYVTIYNQGCLVYRDYVDHHRGRRHYTIHVPPDRIYKNYYRKAHHDYVVIKEKPDVYWTKVRDTRQYVQKNQVRLQNSLKRDISLGRPVKGDPQAKSTAPSVSKEKQLKENFLSMRDALKTDQSRKNEGNSDNFSRDAVLKKSDSGSSKLDKFKSGQPSNTEKGRSAVESGRDKLETGAVRKTDKLRKTGSSSNEKEEIKSGSPARSAKSNALKPKVADPKADQPKTERSKAAEPKSGDSKVDRFKDDEAEQEKRESDRLKSERPDGSQSKLDKSKLDKFRNSERVVASSNSRRNESSPSKVKSSGTVESRIAQSKTAQLKTDKFRSARSSGNGEQKSVRSQASQPQVKSVRKSDASRKSGAPAVKETARAKSSDSRVSMPSGSVRGSSGKSGQKSPRPRN